MSQKVDLQILAGDYVKNAFIAEWKVAVGTQVQKGDVLLCCETGKVTVDILAPCDGTVEQILFPAGEEVDIEQVVAIIGDGQGMGTQEAVQPEIPKVAATQVVKSGRIFVTPVAKKIAKERGFDLEELKKAVGKAKIAKADVLAYAQSREQAPAIMEPVVPIAPVATETAIPMQGRRRAIAQKMHESTSSKPRVTHMMDVELDELQKVKRYLTSKYPQQKFTMTGLIAVAVCKALQDFPAMNATCDGKTIVQHTSVNLGIAVDMPEGLIVPVMHGCERRSGKEICQALLDLSTGTKENTLPPSAYLGGTFTISNLGTYAVRYFTPIINPPEVGILGVGTMREELKLVNGTVEAHHVMGLSLTFDHRAIDGAPAARFLQAVKEYMEHPFLMGF